MSYLRIIFLLFSTSIFAVNYTPPVPNVSHIDSGVSIAPKVNPVTGEYLEEECDLEVAGCYTLSATRFYRHMARLENMYGLWRINPETLVKANFEKSEIPLNVMIGDRFGGATLLDGRREAEKSYVFDPMAQKGVTNTAYGAPSGQTNPKNTKITYWKNCEQDQPARLQFKGTIVDGSGRKLEFHTPMHEWHKDLIVKTKGMKSEMTPHDWTPYQLHIDTEQLPNGNVLHYTYKRYFDDKYYPTYYRIHTITAENKSHEVMGQLTFDYPEFAENHTSHVVITGSDGRKTTCGIGFRKLVHEKLFIRRYDGSVQKLDERNSGCLHLYNSISPSHPDVTYHYNEALLLDNIERPEGRFFKTEYDPESGKVKAQYVPIGPNGELVPIARFEYHEFDTCVFDGENNCTRYRFDENFRVTAIEKYQGKSLYSVERNKWGKNGEILSSALEDKTGKILKKITYSKYDERGNVLEEIHSGVGGEPITIIRTYSEDGFNLKLSESDGCGKRVEYQYKAGTNLCVAELTYEGNELKRRCLHTYDKSAICIETVCDDGLKPTFRKITKITPRNCLPCFGLPESVEEKTIDERGQEILLSKVVYDYAPNGKITKEDHYDATNTLRYSVENVYDERERLKKTVDPLGNVTTFTYDANNNLRTVNGPKEGMFKEITYDKGNRPIKIEERKENGTSLVTTKEYDHCSRVKSVTDGCGFTTFFDYDSLGRLKKVTYPDGSFEKKEYDEMGNVTCHTDGNGFKKITTYNYRGDPLEIIHPDGSSERFTYKKNGFVESHTNQNGSRTCYEFDIFERPLRCVVTSSSGEVLKETYATYLPFTLQSSIDAMGVMTWYSYDFAGRKISEKVGKKEQKYSYDALGRLFSTQIGETFYIEEFDFLNHLVEKRSEDLSHRVIFLEKYEYDELGNRTAVIHSKGATRIIYNTMSLPTSKIDALGNKTTFSYVYGGGLIVLKTDPLGLQTASYLDFRGKERETAVRNRDGNVLHHISRKFDGNGNLEEEKIDIFDGTKPIRSLTNEWKYGPQNRLEKVIESGKKISKYCYDESGRLRAKVKPDGEVLYHEYDELGRLQRYYSSDFDYVYTYDKNDRLKQVYDKVSDKKTERDYDEWGNIKLETLANGHILSSHFDDIGRRKKLTISDGSTIEYGYFCDRLQTVTRKGMTHTYSERDLEGNVTLAQLPLNLGQMKIERDELLRVKQRVTPYYTENFSSDSYDSVGNLRHYVCVDEDGVRTCNYEYDGLYQLISERGHRYRFDSLYNRLRKDGEEYAINELNQIQSDGQSEYKYDLNGNLLSDGNNTYEYDTQDRLIKFNETRYTYDSFHRRLSKECCGVVTIYLWDGRDEIGASTSGGEITELRVLGEGRGENGSAVLMELQGKPYVSIHDYRGCVVSLVDQQRRCVSYRYTSFGESKKSSSPWGFSSKRLDEESGLLYFGRRYYNPSHGRWLTSDPRGFDDGPNLYAYVHNTPLTAVDLYGLISNPFAGTKNLAGFLNRSCYYAFRGIQLTGMHLIPLPGVRDVVESIGRWGAGGKFWQLAEYRKNNNCIAHIPGFEKEGVSLYSINGMNCTFDSAMHEAKKISNAHGGARVDVLYNGSQGFITDLIMCGLAKLGIRTPVEDMINHYFTSKLSTDPAHRFIGFVHSQAATHINNSGNRLNSSILQRIGVCAIGPATIIPNNKFGSAVNILNRIDFVTMTNPLGYIKALLSNDCNVKFVSPTSFSPLSEHSFDSPAYFNEIKKMGYDFANSP